jgi:chemosensory pili system protein ChpC
MSEASGEIYSLLIPLSGGRLLVPRACVAEIAGYQTPSIMPGAPPWYLGLVLWNGRQAVRRPSARSQHALAHGVVPCAG